MMLVCISSSICSPAWQVQCALALSCLKLQAKTSYATTAQNALQHWPSSVHCCSMASVCLHCLGSGLLAPKQLSKPVFPPAQLELHPPTQADLVEQM